jgi:hypothetical protein
MSGLEDHGCEVCRHSWERDATITEQLAYSAPFQTHVYCCVVCGTFWEERGNWIAEVTARRVRRVLRAGGLKPMPDHSTDGRFIIGDVTNGGYGRLLPLLNVFRSDNRYNISELNSATNEVQLAINTRKSVMVSGPSAPRDIEERFILPAGLEFRRSTDDLVTISDPNVAPNSQAWSAIHIEFNSRRARWWQ